MSIVKNYFTAFAKFAFHLAMMCTDLHTYTDKTKKVSMMDCLVRTSSRNREKLLRIIFKFFESKRLPYMYTSTEH
jgi:hypothetical protein